MTVEEAIKELKRQHAALTMETGIPVSANTSTALSMAISALEKEKEPQPVQADKDSSKNNSIDNDNTKLKICQEIIDNQIEDRVDYYNNQLSDDEQEAFNEGQRFRELIFVRKMLKEATK